jgi:hypothetical protein
MGNDEEARSLIFSYLQLKAQVDNLKAEQEIAKAKLEAVMALMGMASYEAPAGKAQIVERHKYAFDCALILKVVPAAAAKMDIANDDFNKVLIGNEVALAEARKVLGTTRSIVITAPRKK